MDPLKLTTPTAALDAEESQTLGGNPAVLLKITVGEGTAEVLLDKDAMRQLLDWGEWWEANHP